jgi:hypothetical protein
MNLPNDNGPQPGPRLQTLEVGEIVLKDAAGRVGARFDIRPAGPRLLLLDANGATRATLAVTGDIPGLVLYDGKGTARATLGLSDDAPILALSIQRRPRLGPGIPELADAVFLPPQGHDRHSLAQDHKVVTRAVLGGHHEYRWERIAA